MSEEFLNYLAASLPEAKNKLHNLKFNLEWEEISPPYDLKGKGCKRILDIRKDTTNDKLIIRWCYEQYD